MRKTLFLILSVMILSVCGCGKKDMDDKAVAKIETEESLNAQTTEESSKTRQEESVKKQEDITEVISETTEEANITPTTEVAKTNNPTEVQTKPSTESKKEPVTEAPSTEVQTEKATEPPKEEKVSAKSYDPNEVVKLATAKTKKAGKTLLTDNLDNLLANGTITKAEYDEYYPYDGAGYYSVFVETDLNHASTIGGESLSSVDAIASYVAEMMALESGNLFLIEYAGTIDHHGTPLYEFRCYRA